MGESHFTTLCVVRDCFTASSVLDEANGSYLISKTDKENVKKYIISIIRPQLNRYFVFGSLVNTLSNRSRCQYSVVRMCAVVHLPTIWGVSMVHVQRSLARILYIRSEPKEQQWAAAVLIVGRITAARNYFTGHRKEGFQCVESMFLETEHVFDMKQMSYRIVTAFHTACKSDTCAQ
jgi:hypothetical protein